MRPNTKLFNLRAVIILLAAFAWNAVSSQQLEAFKNYFQGTDKISSVSEIKTLKDFDQSGLTEQEIDKKIEELISGNAIGEFETPINQKKLKYIGIKNPKEIIDFDVPAYERDMPMINKNLEVFSYDGVWILVGDKGQKNLLNVFFASRAIQILKYKYPEAYDYLIHPDQVELGYKKLGPNDYKPILNKLVPIISFDKSPTKIAGSLWNRVFAKEPTRVYEGIKSYENTLNALTSINYETSRPKEIYGQTDSLKNYWLYLREGLIESIAHEFTHHYVTNFRNFDKKGDHVYNKRYDQSDKSFSFDAEEAIVINTIETYFVKKGGLSQELINFNLNIKYKNKKEVLNNMTVEANKKRFEDLKNLSPSTSTSFDEVYRLDFFLYNSPESSNKAKSKAKIEQQGKSLKEKEGRMKKQSEQQDAEIKNSQLWQIQQQRID